MQVGGVGANSLRKEGPNRRGDVPNVQIGKKKGGKNMGLFPGKTKKKKL